VDAAVEDEALHGFAGDFAADGVEAGEHDGIGGIVDEDGDAGGGFEGADIAAFASDDAAFDVVALEGDGGGGGFEGMVAGVALEGEAEDAAGLVFGAGAGVIEDMAAQVGGVAEGFLFDFFEEEGAGVFGAEVGEALEFLASVGGEFIQFLEAVGDGDLVLIEVVFLFGEGLLALAEGFELSVDEAFALGEAGFEGFDFAASRGEGSLGLLAELEALLGGGEAGFADEGFGFASGGFDAGLLLGFEGFSLVAFFPEAQPETQGDAGQQEHGTVPEQLR
jgi:hypothetical protein